MIYVPKAVIYVPTGNLDHAGTCLEHMMREGYDLDSIATGCWEPVRQMMMDGQVDVVVVADRDDLPPDRTPRIEVAREELVVDVGAAAANGHGPPRQRRPRPTA